MLALSAAGMAVLLAGAFINVLAIYGGPRWLLGYGVFAAMAAAAAAIAVAFTVALFRLMVRAAPASWRRWWPP